MQSAERDVRASLPRLLRNLRRHDEIVLPPVRKIVFRQPVLCYKQTVAHGLF